MYKNMMFKVQNLDGEIIAKFKAKGDCMIFAQKKAELYNQSYENYFYFGYNRETKTAIIKKEEEVCQE